MPRHGAAIYGESELCRSRICRAPEGEISEAVSRDGHSNDPEVRHRDRSAGWVLVDFLPSGLGCSDIPSSVDNGSGLSLHEL